jgi:hypothetical protein
MFNREMRINLVKKNEADQVVVDSGHDVEEIVNGVNAIFNNMFKKAAIATAAYVLLDTGRKVLVATVSK